MITDTFAQQMKGRDKRVFSEYPKINKLDIYCAESNFFLIPSYENNSKIYLGMKSLIKIYISSFFIQFSSISERKFYQNSLFWRMKEN